MLNSINFKTGYMSEKNKLIKDLFKLHDLLADKGEISIGHEFSESYKKLKDRVDILTAPDISEPMELDGFTINPLDSDGHFEISIKQGLDICAYNYLHKDDAITLTRFIQNSLL
jgi:hypothetical protein